MKRQLLLLLALLMLSVPASAQWAALDASRVQIHGFVSQGFLMTDDNNYLTAQTEDGSFEFSEIGLTFSATLSDRMRVGAQILSRDLGALGNHEPQLDWGYGDYRVYDWLGIRLGRIKNPMGLLNETRDLDAVRTSILLPVTYDERFRDVFLTTDGGGIYGHIPLGFLGSADYQGFAGTIDFQDGGALEVFNERLQPGSDVYALQLRSVMGGVLKWNTPLDGLMAGASYYNAQDFSFKIAPPPPVPAGTVFNGGFPVFHMWFFFAEYRADAFRLAAEFARNDAAGSIEGDESLPISTPYEAREGSWYVQADAYLTDWFTLGLTYAEYYTNWHDQDGSLADNPDLLLGGQAQPHWTRWHKETILSLRFDVNDFWSIKLEGHHIDGGGRLIYPDQEGGVDGTERFWNLFAAKTTFTF